MSENHDNDHDDVIFTNQNICFENDYFHWVQVG